MRKSLIVSGVLAVAAGSHAQVMFGGSYSQNFDSLASSGTNNAWTDNVTLAGWYMRRMNDPDVELSDVYNAGDGASNAGAVYSFGTVGSAERALGSVGSASVEHAAYGVRLRNDTGGPITQIIVSYTGEQWRNGGGTTAPPPNSLWFSYNIGGTTIGADTQATGGEAGYGADPNFIRDSAFDFTSPVNTTTSGALDGNNPANQAAISGVLTLQAPWAAGQDLWLRWVDVNNVGNDAGIAIDNLSVQVVPEPATLAALAAGAAVLLRRRRR